MACTARLSLVILAVLGMASQGTLALQPTQSDSGRTFQQLFRQYLQGDAEGAVRAFAAWDDDRIEREAHLPPDTTEHAPALALFHSEAWLRYGAGGLRHYKTAVRLMTKEVCPAAEARADGRILSFCRDWYSVVVVTGELLDYTGDFLPDSAPVQLARGALQEFMAGPEEDSGSGTDHGFMSRDPGEEYLATSHGRFGPRIADAEGSNRRALKIDPHFAEARTRLGHVLFLLDRRDEARKELERAVADAGTIGDSASAYLAAMFLGRLHEESGRIEDAIGSYQRAVVAGPRFPAARVALARMPALTRRGDEASSTMTELFRGLAPSGTSEIDPWTLYPRGRTFWHRHQILRALREVVRQ